MVERGWTRRLDDRADGFLKRRFGFGLTDGPEPNPRQELRRTFILAGGITTILIVALVLSDQSERLPVVLGPVSGAVIGSLVGQKIRRTRRRRRVPLIRE